MTRLILAPTPTEFSRIVQQYENKYKELDNIYVSAVNSFKTLNGSFGKQEVGSILHPYLLRWGRMGRVLGYKGCDRIGNALNGLRPQIGKLQGATLETIDLNEKYDDIDDLYYELLNANWKSEKGRTKRVGPTATAKVLHLALPNLFMIWDRKVRNSLGFGENGGEYIRFLENMQDWNKKLNSIICSLEKKYDKTTTKLIDEYNWKKCWG